MFRRKDEFRQRAGHWSGGLVPPVYDVQFQHQKGQNNTSILNETLTGRWMSAPAWVKMFLTVSCLNDIFFHLLKQIPRPLALNFPAHWYGSL